MADDRDRIAQERLQRKRPADQERRLELEQGGGGWGWFAAWWWIWIIILIFIVWFGGWGGWGYGGWWGWSGRSRAYMQREHMVPDTLVVLTSPDKQTFIGQHISLDRVQVQASAGHNGYWIGPNQNHRLLVLGVNNGALKLQQGQVVSVNGTVERAPSAQQAQNEWGLSSDAAKQLEKDGVYIQAGELQARNTQQR